eukprot:13961624-Heterocapsa_arctica.AAC.2
MYKYDPSGLFADARPAENAHPFCHANSAVRSREVTGPRGRATGHCTPIRSVSPAARPDDLL